MEECFSFLRLDLCRPDIHDAHEGTWEGAERERTLKGGMKVLFKVPKGDIVQRRKVVRNG